MTNVSCTDRYFQQQRDGTVLMKQCGVFRTNCMDCLDRTNVVQGLLALQTLQEQLTVSFFSALSVISCDTCVVRGVGGGVVVFHDESWLFDLLVLFSLDY